MVNYEKIINYISNHAAFISILIVSVMGLNSVFVDKGNEWEHWSWLSLAIIMVAYLGVEFLRYRKDNISVEEHFKKYLLDFENWEETDENNWHYKPHPEFIVCPTEEEYWEVKGGENWVRAATNPRAFVRPMQLQYNQTVITKIVCIYFDEMRYFIPAPKVTGMIGSGENWYYSLCADDFYFFLLPLLTKKTVEQIVETGEFSSRGCRVPVAIFSSEQEQNQFEVFLTQRPIENTEIFTYPSRPNDPYINDKDKEIISYSKVVLARLEEYRGLIQ